MYLELVDVLRCTGPHEDSPLVASISRRVDRDIVDGMLGCSVCFTEYRIEQGVAIFGPGLGIGPDRSAGGRTVPDEDLAVRCAAMLALYDPGGIVILGGEWGLAAPELVELTRSTAILVEPPAGVGLGHGIGSIRTADILPLAPSSVRGIALDPQTCTPGFLASAARALRPGGRLVAPVSAVMPPGLIERARDDRHWVAEAPSAATPPVQLSRVRGPR